MQGLHMFSWSSARPHAVAIGATGFVALVRLTVSDTAGNFAPLIPFVMAVVIAAWYGGLVPGYLATTLSTLAADYLFVPTQHTLRIESLTGGVALGAFVVTGVLITLACESLHRSRRSLQSEQENLRRSLEAQRKLQEALATSDQRKDEFLATLAHELRNPLAPIRNAVHILQRRTDASPDLEWAHGVIARQVTHMARLIDDLMDVARITRGALDLRLERVDIQTIIRDALETSRPMIEANHHDLSVILPNSAVQVEVDPVRLSQVFSNLLNNASKYTPPGGRIQLRARLEGDGLAITVTDNGIGIPETMLSWIFEPFSQIEPSTRRPEGGLGIGLALARRLVQMHGGKLVASSSGVGMGSAFTVYLPVMSAQPAAPAQPVKIQTPPPIPTLRRRVLVADDNHDSALSLTFLLNADGYEARIAGDGMQALEIFNEFRPDIALLDIGLPGLNGYEIARQIRIQVDWDVILIAITGWGSAEHRRRSAAAGFDCHLVKPVDPQALSQLLETLQQPNFKSRHCG